MIWGQFVYAVLVTLVTIVRRTTGIIRTSAENLRWHCFVLFSWAPSHKATVKLIATTVAFCYLTAVEYQITVDSVWLSQYMENIFSSYGISFHVNEQLAINSSSGLILVQRFEGEDVSFRCNVSSIESRFAEDLTILWHKRNETPTDNGWMFDPVKNTTTKLIKTAYDDGQEMVISQLSIINVKNNDFGIYVCSVKWSSKEALSIQVFELFQLPTCGKQIDLLPGASLFLNFAFNVVESPLYSEWSTGVEVNGKDYEKQLKNKKGKCSVWVHLPYWVYLKQYPTLYHGVNVRTTNFTNPDMLPDRPALWDFNRPSKITDSLMFCGDQDFYGFYQFYLDKIKKGDNSSKCEKERIYHPWTFLVKPVWTEKEYDTPKSDFHNCGNIQNTINIVKNERKEDYKEGSFVYENIKSSIDTPHIFLFSFYLIILIINIFSSIRVVNSLMCRTISSNPSDSETDAVIYKPYDALGTPFGYLRFLPVGFDTHVNPRSFRVPYDVFILCSDDEIDRMIRYILTPLQRKQVRAWIRQRDSIPGQCKLDSISKAIDKSKKLIVILSPDLDGIDEHSFREIVNLIVDRRISPLNTLIINKNGRTEHARLLDGVPEKQIVSWQCTNYERSWNEFLFKWVIK